MLNEKNNLTAWQRIKTAGRILTRGTVSLPTGSTDPMKGSLNSWLGLSQSGLYVNEDNALKCTPVYLAVRLFSELLSSMPYDIIEENGDVRTPIDHPVKELLYKPNSYMDHFTYDQYTEHLAELWGNSVSLIRRDDRGNVYELIPIHTRYVTPVMVDGRPMYNIKDQDLGISGSFFPEEVIHFRMMTSNGVWGKSPVDVAREAIGLLMAAESFGSRFFKKGGNLKATLETTGRMGDREYDSFKKRWNEQYTGFNGDFAVPILEEGLSYKEHGTNPEASQLNATRLYQIQEIARVWNLPPNLLKDLSRSTFSNVEQEDLQFFKYSLRAICKSREAELEHKLLSPSEFGRIKIRRNLDSLLRADLKSLSSHIKEMVQIGVMTRNEGRNLLNRNPLDGLDKPLDPANITGKNTQNKEDGKAL